MSLARRPMPVCSWGHDHPGGEGLDDCEVALQDELARMQRVAPDQVHRGACSICRKAVQTGDGHHHRDPWTILEGAATRPFRCSRCGRFARWLSGETWYCVACDRTVKV